jgi:hypothetical protein
MNVLTTTDVPLDTLAAEIKARIEAGDRAADKAADHFRAAGLRLLDAKKHLAAAKIPFDGWLIENDIGRSRAYELIGIAKGTKTLAGIRASTAERVARYSKKNRDAESVTNGLDNILGDRDSALITEIDWLHAEVDRLMKENSSLQCRCNMMLEFLREYAVLSQDQRDEFVRKVCTEARQGCTQAA